MLRWVCIVTFKSVLWRYTITFSVLQPTCIRNSRYYPCYRIPVKSIARKYFALFIQTIMIFSYCNKAHMHHLTCGINSLLHSVNLIVFTLLLVHFILRISPHHSHHLRSHHLSLPLPSTPDLKLISFKNPFLHSHSYSFRTAFMDLIQSIQSIFISGTEPIEQW